ncbi:P-loop containing nucleoside triphosphate hydrolase protein [Cerioporus squamosus]|nr:P-loop containing nucleoside triphosphate hydrolase protein [Cerioporus squamosus]
MLSSDSQDAKADALIGDTGYARTTKELIEFVTTLRALGAQVFLDLPRIVVIGNQSAGKSSLVEAISGISVPRDAGTCTRCPMECRLANTPDSWSCQISIRWEFDTNGERVDEVSEVLFGARFTDKEDVEPMLRRAQAAILNPTVPLSHFLEVDIQALKAGDTKVPGAKPLAFSRNVICVDLAGPDLVDLSFVDLPGIVQNAEPEIVQLVEDLVESYVGGNCLILVTLPMSDDIENQKAARIAKQADPEGLRTIGVLTKPDTLPPGSTKSREMWLDVIEGRRHQLKHGYFCTRQPDDDKRLSGVSTSEARAAEADFFRTTSPWSTSISQGRFGTLNLVKSISELLTRIISDSLPKLIGEVSSQLAACNKQLNSLPPLITTEPAAFVLNLVVTFCATSCNTSMDLPPAPICCITRELPNNVPYAAKKSFMRDFQQSWEQHAMSCFDRVQETFKNVLSDTIKEQFARFGNLKVVISPIVMEQLQIHAEQATNHIKTILALEAATPFTQNTHYFADKRDKQLAQYKQARPHGPVRLFSSPTEENMKNALASLARLGYTVKEEDLGKLNPADEFEEELELMAEVRAYFYVAYKRVIDYIPLSIDQHFLYTLAEGLQPVLLDKLGVGSSTADARCTSYIAEEPGVVSLRSELLSKKKRLESVQKALFNFGL